MLIQALNAMAWSSCNCAQEWFCSGRSGDEVVMGYKREGQVGVGRRTQSSLRVSSRYAGGLAELGGGSWIGDPRVPRARGQSGSGVACE